MNAHQREAGFFRRLFLKLFCMHPFVMAPAKATHRVNENNLLKLTCVTCGKVFRMYGREIAFYKEKECFCVLEKQRRQLEK